MEWLPPALSPPLAAGFLLLSLLTSLITASLGAGGGLLLLTAMSLYLPPVALIPVHGSIQLGSNAGRALMAWRHVDWRTIAWFAPGVLVGTGLGMLVLVSLSQPLWRLIIGGFILFLCWGPPLPKAALGPAGVGLGAAGTSFLTLFVGATGPLVAAFIKQLHRERFRIVATFATTMVLQHGTKVAVFIVTGFAFAQWLPFILAMIACGALGTWLGLRLLVKLPDRRFHRVLNILLTLLALRLLWLAIEALVA